MERANNLTALAEYLVESGMEDNEVQHFIHDKIFMGKSLMDLVRSGDWSTVWRNAQFFMEGEFLDG